MFKRILLSTIILSLTSLLSFSELRGVWLTTNSGLDWPGKSYDESVQKQRMVEILDKLQKAHFNLVLFQVQANGDVAWNSKLQPAMSSITGNGSKRLSYDVCRFVIDECHKRGMKCHAWVVPYRVGSLKNASAYASNKVQHVIKKHPKWCIKYSGSYYIDPANPEAREYLVKLYKEMIDRYDFDGINLDYTRYPGAAFPDDKSYKKYARKKQSKADWRRENINRFVADLYKALKKERPDIVVGSAPIGTYKNVGGTKNSTAYESFQQDPVEWVRSGNHDMVIPQMYWDEKFGFSTHLSTWTTQCSNASLLIGLAPYKMIDGGWNVDVIRSQVEKARKAEGVAGVCFFRAEHVIGNNPRVKNLYRFLVDTPLLDNDDDADVDKAGEFVVEKFME
ncbi:family 10 glycosylhydrolase [uncultured Muribaculum sp.]|uniref:glycoside hydrolase family 10 protein n=1 Tax=uncultured Muribaculum sp. TaxID=1918613 RepID=UPI00259A4BF9|nr:family 10 glycosylhydrolase [uncultured Muribaculum sp.]